ncbi:DNA replication checkpoint mediator MRC1 domain-containing protein [Plasmodiophora brassicae]|uniref:Uncharacterized protein n=2 Tax=Plasmodiophora brassicae TaxID=37360 RepID=A0A3P3XYN2_PLABS|nr:unnamed protein product [Plasmodiophora brassicae]
MGRPDDVDDADLSGDGEDDVVARVMAMRQGVADEQPEGSDEGDSEVDDPFAGTAHVVAGRGRRRIEESDDGEEQPRPVASHPGTKPSTVFDGLDDVYAALGEDAERDRQSRRDDSDECSQPTEQRPSSSTGRPGQTQLSPGGRGQPHRDGSRHDERPERPRIARPAVSDADESEDDVEGTSLAVKHEQVRQRPRRQYQRRRQVAKSNPELLSCLLQSILRRAAQVGIATEAPPIEVAPDAPAPRLSAGADDDFELEFSDQDEQDAYKTQVSKLAPSSEPGRTGLPRSDSIASQQQPRPSSLPSKPFVKTQSTCGLYLNRGGRSKRQEVIDDLRRRSRVKRVESLANAHPEEECKLESTDEEDFAVGMPYSNEDIRDAGGEEGPRSADDLNDVTREASPKGSADADSADVERPDEPECDPNSSLAHSHARRPRRRRVIDDDDGADGVDDCEAGVRGAEDATDDAQTTPGQVDDDGIANEDNASSDGESESDNLARPTPPPDDDDGHNMILDLEAEEEGVSNPSGSDEDDADAGSINEMLDDGPIDDDCNANHVRFDQARMNALDSAGLKGITERFLPLAAPMRQPSNVQQRRPPPPAAPSRDDDDDDCSVEFAYSAYDRGHVPRKDLHRLLIAERKSRTAIVATTALDLDEEEKREEMLFKTRKQISLTRSSSGRNFHEVETTMEVRKWIAPAQRPPARPASGQLSSLAFNGHLSSLKRSGSFLVHNDAEIERLMGPGATAHIARASSLQRAYTFTSHGSTTADDGPAVDENGVPVKKRRSTAPAKPTPFNVESSVDTNSTVFQTLNQNRFQ